MLGKFPELVGKFPNLVKKILSGIPEAFAGNFPWFLWLDEGSFLDFDSLVRVAINVDFAKIWGILSKKYEVGKVPLFRKVPWEGEQSAGVQ